MKTTVNKSMHIAFLKSRLGFKGGLEKYTLKLADAFTKRGCRVTILTTGDPSPLENIDVISLAKTSKCSLYHLTHFDSLCRAWTSQHQCDVIFGMERTTRQTHYRAGSGVHAVYLKRRRLTDSLMKCLSFYVNPLHLQLLRMEKKGFESPLLRVLFANSEMVKKEILSHYTLSSKKIEVVHNGVEWKEWEADFNKTFELPPHSTFQFLFVGNDYKRKGLLFLLKGLALLNETNWSLTVIGRDKNLRFFQKEANRLGIAHKVHFAGPQKDLRSFYQNADSLVIPSIYDPFANVTLEALAMGLYVVSSRFNGGHEILTEQSGCIIENLTSVDSIAEALNKALLNPKTYKRSLSIREGIKELDFSIQLDKIVSLTLK